MSTAGRHLWPVIAMSMTGGCILIPDLEQSEEMESPLPPLYYTQVAERFQYSQRLEGQNGGAFAQTGAFDDGQITADEITDITQHSQGLTGQTAHVHLGTHQIVAPTDAPPEAADREAMDPANSPNRLHRDLENQAALNADNHSLSTHGKAEWNVFASQWWNQDGNGIARRWLSGAPSFPQDTESSPGRDWYLIAENQRRLSPAEKYDLLMGLRCDEQDGMCTIDRVTHCDYSDMVDDDSQCKDEERHPHEGIRVIGPTTAWELENHGIYQTYAHPDGWWGHCNGWASYATAEPLGAPDGDVWVRWDAAQRKIIECQPNEAGCIYFSVGDIEGLMTELYFSDSATFSGKRCNVQPDKVEYCKPGDTLPNGEPCPEGRVKQSECRDINAGAFHIAATGMLGDSQGVRPHVDTGCVPSATNDCTKSVAFVIDHNWDWQVWNFPVNEFNINAEETLDEAGAAADVGLSTTNGRYTLNSEYCDNDETAEVDGSLCKYVKVRLTYSMVSDGVGWSDMARPASERNVYPHRTELFYILEVQNGTNKIVGGEWIEAPGSIWGDSRTAHPDFLWTAVKAQGWGERADDTGGADDNPSLSYPIVRQVLEIAKKAPEPPPAPTEATLTGELVRAQYSTRMATLTHTLPAGAKNVTVSLTAVQEPGSNANLMVRVGQGPTGDGWRWDCRAATPGSNNETCTGGALATTRASDLTIRVSSPRGNVDWQRLPFTVKIQWELDENSGGGGIIFTHEDSPNTAIPDNTPEGTERSVTFNNVMASPPVGSVRVGVKITHTYRGDLKVVLEHEGRQAVLFDQEGADEDNLEQTFTTPVFAGTSAAGGWTLRVSDVAAADTGTLDRWSIEIRQ